MRIALGDCRFPRPRWHDTALPTPLYKGVAVFGNESFDGERRPATNLFDKIVGSCEHSIGMIDRDLPQMLHKELAAGLARDPVGLRIERRGIIAGRPSRGSARNQFRPLLDRH